MVMGSGAGSIEYPLICLNDGTDSHSGGEFNLRCVMALIRHGDRTCKQKVTLKFNDNPPDGFPVNEDIRSFSDIALLTEAVQQHQSSCRSDPPVFTNGLRILRSGKSDLKVKIELNPNGWILKLNWGGNLTELGTAQSTAAGISFRSFFPSDLSSLDVKAYASADARCKETASFFLKGFVPTPVSIRSDDGPDGLGSLDDTPFRHSPMVDKLRSEISSLLMNGKRIDFEFVSELFPSSSISSSAELALLEIGKNHKSFATAVLHLRDLTDQLVESIAVIDPTIVLCQHENIGLMHSRWFGISRGINKVSSVQSSPEQSGMSPMSKWRSVSTQSGVLFSAIQISLIGEIFDNSQYDFRHNYFVLYSISPHSSDLLSSIRDLSTLLNRVITPCEHGLTREEKSFIGVTFLQPLIKKLRFDFRICANINLGEDQVHLERHAEKVDSEMIRTRLYFAHHSHMISLVNILNNFPENQFQSNIDYLYKIDHLGYLSQIVIEVLEGQLGLWKIRVSISIGDDFTEREMMKFEMVKILEGIVKKEGIDNFFNSILSIPKDHLELTKSASGLPTIGESSFENFTNLE